MPTCLPISLLALALVTTHAPQDATGTAGKAALGGLDPVLLCGGQQEAGKAELTLRHGRYLYRFHDESTRARFLADPERWGIAWGGGCGRMGPLSDAGDGSLWTVHDGRIFDFASEACRSTFLESPGRYDVPPTPAPAVDPEAARKGAEWLAKARAAHGGEEALEKLLSIGFLRQDAPRTGWRRRIALILSPVGDVRFTLERVPDDPGETRLWKRWVLSGKGGGDDFVEEGKDTYPVTSPDQIADLHRIAQRMPIVWLWPREDRIVLYAGEGEVGDEPVVELLAYQDGLATTLQLDRESGRILGMKWRGRIDDGMTRDVVEHFTSWHDAKGVSVPDSRSVTADGSYLSADLGDWTNVLPSPRGLDPLHVPAPEAETGGR